METIIISPIEQHTQRAQKRSDRLELKPNEFEDYTLILE